MALAITLTLTPFLLERVPAAALGDDPILTLRMIAVESLVGGMIGVLARLFYFALEALAVGAATMLRIRQPVRFPDRERQADGAIGDAHLPRCDRAPFAANLHWELLRGLVASYDVVPVGADFNARLALKQIADVLGKSFRLALRIASPYVIYALVVNLALALVNRLTQRLPGFLRRHTVCCRRRPTLALLHHQTGDRGVHERLRRLAHFRLADEKTSRRSNSYRAASGAHARSRPLATSRG